MPVIWILIIAALLYFTLRMLEKHHSKSNQKQPADQTVSAQKTVPVVAAPSPDEDQTAGPVEATPTASEDIEKVLFLDTIAGLTAETKTELRQQKLTTPGTIADAPDKMLLAIRGIGPARLKQIRAICAEAKDPESEFVLR